MKGKGVGFALPTRRVSRKGFTTTTAAIARPEPLPHSSKNNKINKYIINSEFKRKFVQKSSDHADLKRRKGTEKILKYRKSKTLMVLFCFPSGGGSDLLFSNIKN